jgi:hypothetical protein
MDVAACARGKVAVTTGDWVVVVLGLVEGAVCATIGWGSPFVVWRGASGVASDESWLGGAEEAGCSGGEPARD